MIREEYERYEKTVTVSAINFNPIWGEKRANLEKIKTMVTAAAQGGANIIAFPELALSGYECSEDARQEQKPCSMHMEAAETIPGPSTEDMAKLTKETGVYVIFGMPERDKKQPNAIYNSAAVVGPNGVVGKYRKLHLSPSPIWTEQICFNRGNALSIFNTSYGPIGIQICADFWVFPELSRILWLKGARLILNCTATAINPGRDEFIIQGTGCRATENLIYTATSNMVGTERTLTYYGHSNIAGPSYPRLNHVYAQGGMQEEIVTATLSFERLHHLWSIIDIKKMHYTKLIANEYSKLVSR
jgi:predicted amidohydrolase